MTDSFEGEQPRAHRWLNVVGAVIGVWLVLGGAILAMSHLGPLRWLAALPVAALGAVVLSTVLPRLASESPGDALESSELTPAERGERRSRCPCCGSPSLDPDVPDQSCAACEWLEEGLPGDTTAPAEVIATARENFRRFLSVYAPDARPEWSPDPPAEDELALRREVIELYARALTEPEDGSVWWEIETLEGRIRDAELDYSLEVEGRAADALEEEEAATDAEQEEQAATDAADAGAETRSEPEEGPAALPEPRDGRGR